VADALVAADPRIALTLTVADCYPVAFAGRSHFGLAHCGWRGVAANVLEATLAALEDPPESISVWIGPGIEAACYPVGAEVSAQFPYSTVRAGTGSSIVLHLDLEAEITRRLIHAGIRPERVGRAGLCTACNPERFFSHRRNGFPSGRMSAFVWLPGSLRPFAGG
jgi:YfiH family protein